MRYQFAGFDLDTELHELRRGEERIPAEPKVMDLLELLVEQNGALVGKRALMDALWPDTATTENSLTRLVSLARAALGEDARNAKLLRTVHRRGYQIAVPVRRSGAASEARRLRGPSVAVLPFDCLSEDPEQEHFADALVDELTSALARRRHFPVVARSSTFAWKGRTVDLGEVGRQLGVRYAIQGSVRRAGPRVRVAFQVIEVATEEHVLAERLEREAAELLAPVRELVPRLSSVASYLRRRGLAKDFATRLLAGLERGGLG